MKYNKVNHSVPEEVRIVARADKDMISEQRKEMLNILKAFFKEEFPTADEKDADEK